MLYDPEIQKYALFALGAAIIFVAVHIIRK